MFPIMLAQGERLTRAGHASCLHQVSEPRLQAGMSAMDGRSFVGALIGF